jgi:hypothetical protein
MPITSLDSCISGATSNIFFFQNYRSTGSSDGYVLHSSWRMSGVPSHAPLITCSQSGYFFDTTTGGDMPYWTFPFVQPTGDKKTYMGICHGAGSNSYTYNFCDRIWQSQEFPLTGTGRYIVDHPTGSYVFPSRDDTGGNSGVGLLMALELTSRPIALTGANKGNGPFVRYTNSDGVSLRTGSCDSTVNSIINLNNAFNFHSFIPLKRQNQDIGIRSIQEIWPSGVFPTNLGPTSGVIVVYRLIETFQMPEQAIFYQGPSILDAPRTELYRGTTPFVVFSTLGVSTGYAFGNLYYIHT